jgi:hypothetical protein
MRRTVLLPTLLVLSLATRNARGQVDTPADVKALLARSKANAGRGDVALSLVGVGLVRVMVEPLPSDAITAGLDTLHVRTLTEGRLRDRGLTIDTVVMQGHVDQATGKVTGVHVPIGPVAQGSVDVQVTVATLPSNQAAIAVNVWFKQPVVLFRDRSMIADAKTWSTGTLYIVGDAKDVPGTTDALITGQLDKFIGAWSSANRH